MCMAQMAGPQGIVVGVEHIPELVEQAKENTLKGHPEYIHQGRLVFHKADGRTGYPPEAPYDCMYVNRAKERNWHCRSTTDTLGMGHFVPSHVGAAANSMHEELVEQLKAPGRMFIPVSDGVGQAIYVVDKDKDGQVTKKRTMDVWVWSFVWLVCVPKNQFLHAWKIV